MTEYVYGPLHQELNSFREDLIDFQSSTNPTNRISTLSNFMKDYRYGFAKGEIHDTIEKLQNRLLPYSMLFSEAQSITQSNIEQSLDAHQIDRFVVFKVLGRRQEILYYFNMIDCIFKDKTPMQFLSEQPIRNRNTSSIVRIGTRPESSGEHFSNEHIIEQISKDVLEKLRKDPTAQEQWDERKPLVRECTSLLAMIRKEIILS